MNRAILPVSIQVKTGRRPDSIKIIRSSITTGMNFLAQDGVRSEKLLQNRRLVSKLMLLKDCRIAAANAAVTFPCRLDALLW